MATHQALRHRAPPRRAAPAANDQHTHECADCGAEMPPRRRCAACGGFKITEKST